MIEIRLDDKGALDEVVGDNVFVHLEHESDQSWFLNISEDKRKPGVLIYLTTQKGWIKGTVNDERRTRKANMPL